MTSEVLRSDSPGLSELARRSAARGPLDLRTALAPDGEHFGWVMLYDSRDRPMVAEEADLPPESGVLVAWLLNAHRVRPGDELTVELLDLTAAELMALERTRVDIGLAQALWALGEDLVGEL